MLSEELFFLFPPNDQLGVGSLKMLLKDAACLQFPTFFSALRCLIIGSPSRTLKGDCMNMAQKSGVPNPLEGQGKIMAKTKIKSDHQSN